MMFKMTATAPTDPNAIDNMTDVLDGILCSTLDELLAMVEWLTERFCIFA